MSDSPEEQSEFRYARLEECPTALQFSVEDAIWALQGALWT